MFSYELESQHYFWSMVRRYDSIENYIDLFMEHNQTLIHSIDSNIDGNLLIFTIKLNAREFNRNILKYGYCKLWQHEKDYFFSMIRLTSESFHQD